MRFVTINNEQSPIIMARLRVGDKYVRQPFKSNIIIKITIF